MKRSLASKVLETLIQRFQSNSVGRTRCCKKDSHADTGGSEAVH
jgi:hypothetical protein